MLCLRTVRSVILWYLQWSLADVICWEKNEKLRHWFGKPVLQTVCLCRCIHNDLAWKLSKGENVTSEMMIQYYLALYEKHIFHSPHSLSPKVTQWEMVRELQFTCFAEHAFPKRDTENFLALRFRNCKVSLAQSRSYIPWDIAFPQKCVCLPTELLIRIPYFSRGFSWEYTQ